MTTESSSLRRRNGSNNRDHIIDSTGYAEFSKVVNRTPCNKMVSVFSIEAVAVCKLKKCKSGSKNKENLFVPGDKVTIIGSPSALSVFTSSSSSSSSSSSQPPTNSFVWIVVNVPPPTTDSSAIKSSSSSSSYSPRNGCLWRRSVAEVFGCISQSVRQGVIKFNSVQYGFYLRRDSASNDNGNGNNNNNNNNNNSHLKCYAITFGKSSKTKADETVWVSESVANDCAAAADTTTFAPVPVPVPPLAPVPTVTAPTVVLHNNNDNNYGFFQLIDSATNKNKEALVQLLQPLQQQQFECLQVPFGMSHQLEAACYNRPELPTCWFATATAALQPPPPLQPTAPPLPEESSQQQQLSLQNFVYISLPTWLGVLVFGK